MKMKMKITETQMKNKVEVDMRRIEPENTYILITALDTVIAISILCIMPVHSMRDC